MKHGKKPTREQRRLMEKYHVDTKEWLVSKDTTTSLALCHRWFSKTKVIPKGVREDG